MALVLAWCVLAAIPLGSGDLGISWDMLNHHVYLGWSANSPRFDFDVLPASYQTYQFPYLYWPVYKLAAAGASGLQAALVLATLHALTLPPLWWISRECIQERTWFGAFMRICAVLLAYLSGLVLSLTDSTANDLLGAVPYLWAIAIAFAGLSPARRWPDHRYAALSGALAGISVACKLSNAPLVLLLPLLWVMVPSGWRQRCKALVAGSAALVLGFGLAYGYWGWQLWSHFQNPFFPFAHWVFESLGAATMSPP